MWNFVQFPLPKGGNGTGATPHGTQQTPGALGFGLRKTNAIFTSISFLSPVLRVFGAWLADVKIGRFRVLALATAISCTYMVLLVVSGLPSVLRSSGSTAPFMIGYCLRTLLATRQLYRSEVETGIDIRYSSIRSNRQLSHNGSILCAT